MSERMKIKVTLSYLWFTPNDSRAMDTTEVSFTQVVSRGCGIDVHQKVVVATISGEGIRKKTQEYGTFTRSLTEMKERLLE